MIERESEPLSLRREEWNLSCVDPTPEENDDGPRYREFLLNAQPLFIPRTEVGTLFTSRLEKYRPEIMAWLKKNHVKYDKLVMLDPVSYTHLYIFFAFTYIGESNAMISRMRTAFKPTQDASFNVRIENQKKMVRGRFTTAVNGNFSHSQNL